MADFAIKQNDTVPTLQVTLYQGSGAVQDLTGCAVTFRMETLGGTTIVNEGPCSIIGLSTAGQVQYAWQFADTSQPGLYRGEFHVLFPGGPRATFPTLGMLMIDIEARLT